MRAVAEFVALTSGARVEARQRAVERLRRSDRAAYRQRLIDLVATEGPLVAPGAPRRVPLERARPPHEAEGGEGAGRGLGALEDPPQDLDHLGAEDPWVRRGAVAALECGDDLRRPWRSARTPTTRPLETSRILPGLDAGDPDDCPRVQDREQPPAPANADHEAVAPADERADEDPAGGAPTDRLQLLLVGVLVEEVSITAPFDLSR